MLERLLEARWLITALLSNEAATKKSDRYLDLKTQQWELAEKMVKVLQPLLFIDGKKTPVVFYE